MVEFGNANMEHFILAKLQVAEQCSGWMGKAFLGLIYCHTFQRSTVVEASIFGRLQPIAITSMSESLWNLQLSTYSVDTRRSCNGHMYA